ncbi:MAG: hypothetical protein AB8H80_23250 [Planctomycetota bacterium]
MTTAPQPSARAALALFAALGAAAAAAAAAAGWRWLTVAASCPLPTGMAQLPAPSLEAGDIHTEPAATNRARADLKPERQLDARCRGRAIDPFGHPVAGIGVVHEGADHLLITATDGTFASRVVAPARYRLHLPDGMLAIPSSLLLAFCPKTLVVATTHSMIIQVVGADGATLPAAQCGLRVAVEVPEARGRLTVTGWATPVDDEGMCRIDRVPHSPRTTIVVRCRGFASRELPVRQLIVDSPSPGSVPRITLEPSDGRTPKLPKLPEAGRVQGMPPPSRAPNLVTGRVVDNLGRPIAGARIGLVRPAAGSVAGLAATFPSSRVTTDRGGRFKIFANDRASSAIAVHGRHIVPQRLALPSPFPAGGIEIETARRRWLCAGSSPIESLRARDTAGKLMPIWSEGNARARYTQAVGPHEWFAVHERVQELVRVAAGGVVERFEIRHAPASRAR